MYAVDWELAVKSMWGFPYNMPLILILGPIIIFPLSIALVTFYSWNLTAFNKLLYSVTISIIAMIASIILIPWLKNYTEKADIFGIDLNKPGEKSSKPRIPEAAGIITSIVFLIACT